MLQTVYIDIPTESARAVDGGQTTPPSVRLRHLTDQTLAFAFMPEDGEVGAVAGWISGSVTLKAHPEAAVLLIDTSLEEYGAGEEARYKAVWPAADLDSPALRSFIGKSTSDIPAWCTVRWTTSTGTWSTAFEVLIAPSYYLPEDEAPDPVAHTSLAWLAGLAVLFSQPQVLSPEQRTQALENLGLMPSEDGTITWPTGHTLVLNAPA